MNYLRLPNPLRLSATIYTAAILFTAVVLYSPGSSGYAGCGRPPIEPRLNASNQIEIARPYSWPWVAGLCGSRAWTTNWDISCQQFSSGSLGTIVGRRWVLTTNGAEERVRAGTYNWVSESM